MILSNLLLVYACFFASEYHDVDLIIFYRYTGYSYERRIRFNEPYAYHMERYQPVEQFVEVIENKLWSLFRPITQKGLETGVKAQWKYHQENDRKPLRNDELITQVVNNKKHLNQPHYKCKKNPLIRKK